MSDDPDRPADDPIRDENPGVPAESTVQADGQAAADAPPGIAATEPDPVESEASVPQLDDSVETPRDDDPPKADAVPDPKPDPKTNLVSESTHESPVPEEDPSQLAMEWYILKVQSNREGSVADALKRRVAVEGLEPFFGDIIVPTEKVTEFKGGKKRVVQRKLYPGYLLVQMQINDDTWFVVRETPGIGDFTGAGGRPTPMLPHEVQRIVAKQEDKADEAPKLKISFHTGDRVKINEGTFENFEGEVSTLDQASGRVTVMINIFGRSTPVELEYWQVESV